GGAGQDLGLDVKLTEKTRLVRNNGDAEVGVQYNDLHLSDAEDDTMFRKQLRGLERQIPNLKAEVIVTKEGKFRSPKLNEAEVSRSARPILEAFNAQVIQALEGLSLHMPNKDVAPGETWTVETPYSITFLRKT